MDSIRDMQVEQLREGSAYVREAHQLAVVEEVRWSLPWFPFLLQRFLMLHLWSRL